MHKQLRDSIGRSVAVQIDDDTLAGTLTHVDADSLKLEDAAVVTGKDPVPMDGFTLIPLIAVRWVQVV